MSLDIAIIDKSGKPKESISLTVNEHWVLVQQALQMALPLWTRMSDYYSDVDYCANEIPALAIETAILSRECHDPDALNKLKEIARMLSLAASECSAVCAIAD